MSRAVKIIDEENNVGEYEFLCTFDSKLTSKSYIVYTEYAEDKEGSLLMHAGSYVKNGEDFIVNKQLDKQEYDMISHLMNNMIDYAKKVEK